ncbi:MAG: heme NO-binding domain-containing protein [Burkholderiaceae bacterium]|jgi:hypothetical protein|nr:heme NO-binding domain-containing protein [Burkholderiaceae bacterium]
MYGLVNRAIEQMVTSLHGEGGWRQVCAHAGTDADGFVAMRAYDDAITQRLVAAVSRQTGLPPEAVLHSFGEYWILYTADSYGEVLGAAGASLRDFLANLNELHGRLEHVFPAMKPPQFRVEDLGVGHYRLHYGSPREGLAPMVLGLVQGLARRFGQRIEITQIHAKQRVDEEDVFDIVELRE